MQQLSLSIEEVQIATGIGRTSLYEIINSGRLPAKKWGKRTLVLESDLRTFLSGLPSYTAKDNLAGEK